MKQPNLSRRDFLKLSASGALGLALSEMGIDRALASPPASQGRIIWSGVPLYDAPSFNAKEIMKFGIDITVELKSEVEGDEDHPQYDGGPEDPAAACLAEGQFG